MDLDFDKICRVCMHEGVMMPIFKVNVSKKLMACASVQVWQNDGMPPQICNKCSARLHISFQFKKQCEKSDAILRQQLLANQSENEQDPLEDGPLEGDEIEKEEETNKLNQLEMHNQLILSDQMVNQQSNCVYVECDQIMEIPQQQDGLGLLNYATPQNGIHLGGYNNIQGVGQMQVYNADYTMPLQSMQPSNQLHGHLGHLPPLQPNPQGHLQPIGAQATPLIPPTSVTTSETSERVKKVIKKKQKSVKTSVISGYQCNVCSKIFQTLTKLTRHMKTHSSEHPYKCQTCSKSFAHSGNYKIHLRMHTDERPFKCNICEKGCRQAQDLEKHMRTHTGDKPHQCTMCPKAFSTSSNLIAHIRTHTGERPYVCCVCQKAFCQSNELTKHMRTHTGEKSHICDICHKGFNGSSTLIVHRRSHTGEKPYVCTYCKRAFSQSSCLANHIRRHDLKNNTLQCQLCELSFTTRPELEDHVLTHENEPDQLVVICQICEKQFVTHEDLEQHLTECQQTAKIGEKVGTFLITPVT